jgi:hypothetical protein
MSTYSQTLYQEKLKDPRWQKKRLEILQKDSWACVACGGTDQTLHVHHLWYEDHLDPWEYPGNCFITLCERCHELVPSGFNLTRIQTQLSTCDKVAIDRNILRLIFQLKHTDEAFLTIKREIIANIPSCQLWTAP